MQSLSVRDCVQFFFYLNTHKSYLDRPDWPATLYNYRGPKLILTDPGPRTPQFLDPLWYMFDISQDQRAQKVYTLISLLFLSANLIYIIVLTQFIFESKVFLILKMSLLSHSFVNFCSISVLVFVVWKPCWKLSQQFPENKISFACYHFQQNNFHEI